MKFKKYWRKSSFKKDKTNANIFLELVNKYKPKSFLELRKNFSIIDYQIELLRKLKIKKIIIVVGYKYFLFKKKHSSSLY